jgi:hypothetical protein
MGALVDLSSIKEAIQNSSLTNLQICSECNEDQPAAAFHRSKSYNDGLYGKCKRCCAMALQRRRAAAEGGSLPPTPHSGSRRGNGRHQHYEPHFGGGLGSADISSMLSDATRYGDPITKVTAPIVMRCGEAALVRPQADLHVKPVIRVVSQESFEL